MSKSSVNDGTQLELAVAEIERLILETSGIPPEKLAIEVRKKIELDGVTDEIDLYIRVDNAPGYSSVYIAECRDRQDPADKNDLYVFLKKMEHAGAQAGFFVARRFTKSARQLAKKYPRLRLSTVKNFDPAPIFRGAACSSFEIEHRNDPVLRWRSPKSASATKPTAESEVLFAGQKCALKAAVGELCNVAATLAAPRTGRMEASVEENNGAFALSLLLPPGTLTFGNSDCVSITVNGVVRMTPLETIVSIAAMEVEGRGKSVVVKHRIPGIPEPLTFEYTEEFPIGAERAKQLA